MRAKQKPQEETSSAKFLAICLAIQLALIFVLFQAYSSTGTGALHELFQLMSATVAITLAGSSLLTALHLIKASAKEAFNAVFA